jgi:hypothetical protein
MEPQDVGDAAPCPQCGIYLYPLSWGQTWGLALGAIGATVLFLVAATWALPRL